ncbi:MAG TPA: quinolinate synthase NadA, partial [Methanomicrobiales archaeon]|nr:quinolinate synthase NadA [Methanomicrobiales archaeon]
ISDHIASTGGMVRLAHMNDVWSVFTERDMAHRLKQLFPEKTFYAREGAVCYDMKLTRLEDLRRSLLYEQYEVTLPKDVMENARGAIERMLAVGR